QGHDDHVWSLAWMPSGESLASASSDKTMRIWSPTGGAEMRELAGHDDTQQVLCVSWKPDGRVLASGSCDKTIRLWRPMRSESELGCLTGTEGWIYALAWTPDGGDRLASAGGDNTIRIWCTSQMLQLHCIDSAHSDPVRSIGWSPQGKWLASGSSNKGAAGLSLWDASTAEPLGHLEGHYGGVCVAWAPPGAGFDLATGSGDKIILWDVEAKKKKLEVEGHEGAINLVAVSPDGELIASCSRDQTVRVWDTMGVELMQLEGHTGIAWSVAWSTCSKRLASGGGDGIRIWHPTSGEQLGYYYG
ncbi:unnamed protein product, partial [Chrysoparadoxa australica]